MGARLADTHTIAEKTEVALAKIGGGIESKAESRVARRTASIITRKTSRHRSTDSTVRTI